MRIELDQDNDRFHRFGLISWWDQKKLAAARVLVVGAGALGNEILKNLALLGVGRVFVVDLDRIENSNLSRSVLYRSADNGKPKAQVAADAARHIYPDLKVTALNGNVVYDLGLGVFRWASLVIAGLDNREARLAINRACWKVNRPWIDGAIEQISGHVRMFVPDGPCYECTMSELDWTLLQNRRSCNLLSRPEMEGGKTPTTPTIASMIAALQCQEAVKHLHGLSTLAGRGWVFDGLSGDTYAVEFQRKQECYSHQTLTEIQTLSAGMGSMTLAQLLGLARQALGPQAQLEMGRDMLAGFTCPRCGTHERRVASLGQVSAAQGLCPRCPQVMRQVHTFHQIRGDEDFLEMTAQQAGIPAYDIVVARAGQRSLGLELGGDAQQVLGEVYEPEGLEWDESEESE